MFLNLNKTIQVGRETNYADRARLQPTKAFTIKLSTTFESYATKRHLCGSQSITALVTHMWKPPALAANRAYIDMKGVA